MEKKKVTFIIIGIVILITILGIGGYFIFKAGQDMPTHGNVTPEPTPTGMQGATDTPMPTPTNTPEPTQGIDPTDIPVPTDMPEATQTPEPTPSPTPTNTPVPSQTPTPEPTPTMTVTPTYVSEPTPTPLVEYKKDGVDVPIVQTFQVSDTTYVYVYENGNIGVADSASGYSQKYATRYENPESVDVTRVVKSLIANESESIKEKKITIDVALIPTPTPTPTPFPTPNPEQPKMLVSFDCSESGSKVTQEMWDNEYIYIKGTGATRWIGTLNAKPEDEPALKALGFLNKYEFKPSHLVVKEGVTSLGDSPMCVWYKSLIYIELPSTLQSIRTQSFNLEKLMENDITVSGYKNGEKITFIVPAYTRLGDAIVENLDVKSN